MSSNVIQENNISNTRMIPPSFERSKQPDILLAWEKDNYYNKYMRENLIAISENIIGGRRAQLLIPEINFIVNVLYYGLTIGMCNQTLGQEYCDIMLTKSQNNNNNKSSLPVALSKFTAYNLILTIALMEYLWQRRKGWISDYQQLRSRRLLVVDHQRYLNLYESTLPSNNTTIIPTTINANNNDNDQFIFQIKKFYRKNIHKWLKFFIPASKENAYTVFQRVHLMLFFLNGKYFQIPMRIFNAKLTYNKHMTDRRASYNVLGRIIAIQLILQFGSNSKDLLADWLLMRNTRSRGSNSSDRAIEDESHRKDFENGIHEVSNSDRQNSDQKYNNDNFGDDGNDNFLKCVLCMSRAESPSSTPCGHIFCWNCIMSWLLENGQHECPLCRQQVRAQEVILLMS